MEEGTAMPKRKGFQDPERAREIVRLIEEKGWLFEDVGDVYGFSRQRAYQIYKKATGRQRQRPTCATTGCSKHPRIGDRCRKCREHFIRHGSYTEKQSRSMFEGVSCPCGKPAARRPGLCISCYARERYRSDPDFADRKKANNRRLFRNGAKTCRNPEKLERLKRYLSIGLSHAEIARREGVHPSGISAYLRMHRHHISEAHP